MKFNNILNFIIVMFITSTLNAQEFYLYKLFNDKFQVIFPSTPTLTYDKGTIKIYSNYDKKNDIAYMSKYITYSAIFNKDIIFYKKQDIDDMILKPVRAGGQQIISFTSVKNIKNKQYSYNLTTKYKDNNTIMFQSSRGIIYKTELYEWSIRSSNLEQRDIFNSYKEHCKVIK